MPTDEQSSDKLVNKIRRQALELSELYRELDEREKTIKGLRSTGTTVENASEKVNALKKHCKTARNKASEYKQKNIELESSIQDIRMEKDRVVSHVRKLEEQMIQLHHAKRGPQDNKNEQTVYINILEEALQFKAQDLGISDHAELLAVLAELKRDVRLQNEEIQSKNQTISGLELQLKGSKRQAREIIRLEMQSVELEQKLVMLSDTSELPKLQSRCKHLENEKQAVVDYAQTLSEQLKHCETEIIQLRTIQGSHDKDVENQVEKEALLNEKIQKLIKEMAKIESEAKETAEQFEKLQQETEDYQVNEMQQQMDLEVLKTRTESLQVVQDDLLDTIQQKSKENQELLEQLELLKHDEGALEDLRNQIVLLHEQRDLMEVELNDLTERFHQSEAETDRLRRYKSIWDNNSDDPVFLKTRVDRLETLAGLMDQLEQHLQRTADSESENPTWCLESLNTLLQKRELKQILPSFQAICRGLHRNLMRFCQEKASWDTERQHLRACTSSLEETVKIRQEQLEALTHSHTNLEEESNGWTQKQLFYESQLNDLRNQLQKSQFQTRDYQKALEKIQQLEKTIRETERKIQEVSDRYSETVRQNIQFKEQQMMLKTETEENHREIKRLESRIKDKERSCEVAEEKESRLKQDLEAAASLVEEQNRFCLQVQEKLKRMAAQHTNVTAKYKTLSHRFECMEKSTDEIAEDVASILPRNLLGPEWFSCRENPISTMQFLVGMIKLLYQSKTKAADPHHLGLEDHTLHLVRQRDIELKQVEGENQALQAQLSFLQHNILSPEPKPTTRTPKSQALNDKLRALEESFSVLRGLAV